MADDSNSKWRKNEDAMRGQTIRTEFGRDRSDDDSANREAMMGKKMGGGTDDLSHSIKGSKVPDV